MPVGPGTKVQNVEEVPIIKEQFMRIAQKFDIEITVYDRIPKGPDGNGIGPALEARDLLYILDRRSEAPKKLENEALNMAGVLLEMVGVAPTGKGFEMAKAKLDSGEAKDKFWEIALEQGAKKRLTPDELLPGKYKFELEADHSGVITFIDSREVVEIARHLGCPLNKHAGLYFYKDVGDDVKRGDIYATVYATSQERIDMTKRMMEQDPDILVKVE